VAQDSQKAREVERSHFDRVTEVEQSEGHICKTLAPVLSRTNMRPKVGDGEQQAHGSTC
jgi:hypothetical protein